MMVQNFDGIYLYRCRPNGRLDTLVNVPDEPMSWVISAFGISRNLGFGILHTPARVTSHHTHVYINLTFHIVLPYTFVKKY